VIRARALLAAGVLAHFRGDDERAIPWLDEAARLWTVADDAWGIGYTELARGVVEEDAGRYDEAEPRLIAALTCLTDAGAATGGALAHFHLGVVAYGRGNLAEAERYLTATLTLAGPPERRGTAAAYALQLRGLIAAESGDADRAAALLGESLAICRSLGNPAGISDALAGFAVLAARVGQAERGALLFGAVAAMDEISGARFGLPERITYERVVGKLRAALGEAAFAAAEAAGRKLSIEETIAEATAIAPEAEAEPARQAEAARPERIAADQHGLTAREIEILGLLAQGRSNREIAEELFISPRTAGTHVANLCGKLGVHNRAAAAARAFQIGLA
jgi:non-specific serine/threonine protein kinase